ncbi:MULTISPECIES: hypothetical protein [Lysobacter]|uniref:Glycosyltransferase RgtA/B/C/D-like domain-containing protein n=1 Tax=Lysobacter firmicutimachus TaxID=1792846 RepID=A0ABU8CZR5_9GAMM|nr:hypothetical protein [Lysobacter antibioticus]
MEYLKALAEFGIWTAIYPSGLGVIALGGEKIRVLARNALVTLCVGSAAWTVLLIALALSGLFFPVAIGILGWGVTIVFLVDPHRRRAMRDALPDWRWSLVPVALIVVVAGFLYAGFPKQSLLGERDEGIYAQHALHLLRAGTSRIDLQRLGIATDPAVEAIEQGRSPELPGIYPTGTAWTYQFSAATPVWMAMLGALLGPLAIFRLNAVIGVLNCLAFYALAVRCLPPGRRHWAVAALAAFAFQPAQVWISRNSLSEPFCAWFVLNGLWIAAFAISRRSAALGWFGGAMLGMSTLVRIDAVVFSLTASLAAVCFVAIDRTRGRSLASVAICIAAGCSLSTVLALLYFAVFVRPYLIGLADLVLPALSASLSCLLGAWLCSRMRFQPLSLRASNAMAWWAAAGFLAVFVYAMWIRPSVQPYALIESKLVPHLNGTRDYREISLGNLSAYLGTWVVLAAALGAGVGLWRVLRRPTAIAADWMMLFLFVPMTIYLWRPMISPDHVWAARRWVPTVFPAILVFAAIGAALVGSLAPRRVRTVAIAAVSLALSAHLLWQQREYLFLREDRDMVAQIEAIAGFLPVDSVSYVAGSGPLASALLSGFGRPVAMLPAQPQPLSAERLARYGGCAGRPCVIVHPSNQAIAGSGARTLAELPIVRVRRNTAFHAPARGVHQERSDWRITRIEP